MESSKFVFAISTRGDVGKCCNHSANYIIEPLWNSWQWVVEKLKFCFRIKTQFSVTNMLKPSAINSILFQLWYIRFLFSSFFISYIYLLTWIRTPHLRTAKFSFHLFFEFPVIKVGVINGRLNHSLKNISKTLP